eukprot:g2116.t1
MPGDDDVVILGNPTLKALGIDVYDTLGARAREQANIAGVDTAAYKQCRRVTVSVDALQDQHQVPPPAPDPAVERLLSRGPDMCLTTEEESAGRAAALEEAVAAARKAGLGDSYVLRLREVIRKRWNVFRRGLRPGDPPASVEPLRVTLKPDARPVKARARVYNPVKSAWLAACMASLVALGLVFFNLQAVWASAAMVLPKKQPQQFRLVADYRPVNARVEQVPAVMPNQEASMAKLSEAKYYGSLDMLQGYWQLPLAPEAQELFTISTPDGLYTPTRVPQGILNATSFFQATMTQVPEGEVLRCVPVEDMSHEPVGFLSGTFRGSQQRWATIDKECVAIVSTFRRLEYLLWNGVRIHTDHRNLAYIFNPEACVSSVAKTTAQRLDQWKAVLGQYDYTIEHIQGDVREVHVTRIRFYADRALAITAELKDVFQHSFTQGEFEMAAIVDMSEAEEGPGFDVEVEWVGFDKSENTWEALEKIWNASPQFVKSELRKLNLRKAVRAELKKQHGIVF